MDSGVSILKFSMCKAFGEAWGLETTVKPERFYIFYPFYCIL